MIKLKTVTFWKTTIALSIGSLLIFGNVYLTQAVLPVFTEEFHVSPLLSSMSVSVVILTLGLSLLFYGPLSDSVGRRGIMILTMLGAVCTTFLAAFSTSFEMLLLIRVLQGFFLGGLPSIAVAYIGEEYSKHAISLAIGIYISGNAIGGMFGRILGGVVTDLSSWRMAFITMGIISIFLFAMFVLLLRPSQHFKPNSFNLKGVITSYKDHISNHVLTIAFAIGGLHFLLFVGHFNYVTYLLSAPPYNLPPSLLGLLFLTYLAGMISSPIAGKVSVILSKSSCIAIGIFIMYLGFFLTLLTSINAIISGLLLNCFGFFFAHSAASSWVSARATHSRASATGLYLISYYIGGSAGPIYLEPFWNLFGWNGVVLGCIFILIFTSILTIKLYKVEKFNIEIMVKN